MATDFFLKLDSTIQGESTDEKHTGELEIESWSWHATNTGTSGSGGGSGTGKADFADIAFSKFVDKATPKIINAVATGAHFASGVLTCRKASGKGGQVEYLKMTLGDFLISSYSTSASEEHPIPRETFTINYATIQYEYAPQKKDGTLEGKISAKYDRHLNKAS